MALIDFLSRFWSSTEIAVNLIVLANIVGALLLGMLVGYERTYRGRAAGMRTYGLVCMSSCALTVLAGYPSFWYGGHALSPLVTTIAPDPTRVIQGVVTGIGFLGAGVIMRDGFHITGLTSAAAIWTSSAIGILTGVGFYSAAILLSFLTVVLMLSIGRLESRLPSRAAVSVMLRFKPGYQPRDEVLKRVAQERGYKVLSGSLNVSFADNAYEWRYLAVAADRHSCTTIATLSNELAAFDPVEKFEISHTRN